MKTVFIKVMRTARADDGIKRKLDACYGNTGNLLWHDCCRKGIDFTEEIEFDDLTKDKDVSDSVLVFPISNNISPYESEFSKQLIKLLNIKAQFAFIGLGAQSSKELSTPKKLVNAMPKRKIKLLQQLADKSVSIGVRGEFSAECLSRMGIHNWRIIGCPSFYSIEFIGGGGGYSLPSAGLKKVGINLTAGKSNEHKLIESGIKSGIDMTIFMQNMRDMPDVVYENRMMTKVLLGKAIPNITIKSEELQPIWRKHAKIFFDINEWMTYMKEIGLTFSVGSRLHGNMTALLAGVPALWITHDSRTSEIAQLLKLPHVSYKYLSKIKYMEQLLERCVYTQEFYDNYHIMKDRYIDFLEENNIEHKFEREEIIKPMAGYKK